MDEAGHSNPSSMSHSRSITHRHSPRRSDGVTLLAIGLAAMLTLGLGYQTQQLSLAVALASVALLLAGAVFGLAGGSTLSRYLLTLCAFGVATSHIYLSGARAESYVGVILLGCLLPQYRDWKLVVSAGVAALAFHLLWSVHQPGHAQTAAAVGILTLQYGYMAYTARRDAIHERERFELAFLIHAMGADGPIRLNLDVLRADSTVGKRLKHVQARMADAIRQVQDAIDGVQRASGVLSQGSAELSDRTHSTASGLRDAAMCLEQINVIVQTSAQASTEARTMAARATELADHGGEQVKKLVETMQDIAQSSGRITDIISVIDGIAFQTNILALNAAVEAARAGEQGRGFAVVAAEVRSLALRSSAAAQEIKSLITNSMQTVESGVKQVTTTGETMGEIVDAVRGVGSVFERLSADSHEHAGGIEVVTQSVKELDAVTQQNTAVAEASSNIAVELMEHAKKMSDVLSAFKLGGASAKADPTSFAVATSAKPARAPSAETRAQVTSPKPAEAEGVEFF